MTAVPQQIQAGVWHLRCPNPGPMTLTGTNTYVVLDPHPDAGVDVVVVDPGPGGVLAAQHDDAVVGLVGRLSRTRMAAVVATHHHDDHVGGMPHLLDRLSRIGVDARGHGAQWGPPSPVLGPLETISTPGHTQDSVSLLLERDEQAVLFSGDTLLGGSSSFIADPDGDLTRYLASLDLLARRLDGTTSVLAPGHGELGLDAAQVVDEYRRHRRERLTQVQAVLDRLGPEASLDAAVAEVYPDVDAALRPAVEAVVRAQTKHLLG